MSFSRDMVHVFSLNFFHKEWHFKKVKIDGLDKEGLYVVTKLASVFNRESINVFQCNNNTLMSSVFVCDVMDTCDGFTSKFVADCLSLRSLNNTQNSMTSGIAVKSPLCPPLLSTNIDGSCQMVLQQNKATQVSQPNDLHTLNETIKNRSCKDQGLMQCFEGSQTCFSVPDICVYKVDSAHHLIPCHSGEHVQECKTFKCNMMLKCPRSHCVPWSYMCDGKWDCPGGYDEDRICNDSTRCHHLFKCRDTSQCVHVADVCDGKVDCLQIDDELACELLGVTCPGTCRCFLFAIYCFDVQDSFIVRSSAFPFRLLTLKNCKLQFAVLILQNVECITVLAVINCSLEAICKRFPLSVSLLKLDLSSNKITSILDGCFHPFKHVREINLHSNNISVVHKNAFTSQEKLLMLNLSMNSLLEILHFPVRLKGLSLRGNLLHNQDPEVFSPSSQLVLFTDAFTLCCIAFTKIFCLNVKSWDMNCCLLLDIPLQLGLFVALPLLCFAINIYCCTAVLKNAGTNENFKNIVKSITVSNLLGNCGLLILDWNSFFYGNQFALHQQRWQAGPGCLSVFILTVIFNISCPLFHLVLSFCRLIIVLYPMNPKYKQPSFVYKQVGSIFLLSTFASILCVVNPWHSGTATLPSKMCSPFFDPTKLATLIKFTSQVIIAVQLFVCVSVVFCYICLQVALTRHHKIIQRSSDHNTVSFSSAAKRSSMFALSAPVSWVPSSTVYLTCLYLETYPEELMIWLILSATTTSTTVNPILFLVWQ